MDTRYTTGRGANLAGVARAARLGHIPLPPHVEQGDVCGPFNPGAKAAYADGCSASNVADTAGYDDGPGLFNRVHNRLEVVLARLAGVREATATARYRAFGGWPTPADTPHPPAPEADFASLRLHAMIDKIMAVLDDTAENAHALASEL